VPPRRRDALLGLLGVDLRWRMHSVSDGQRRRVQILLGLLSPSRLLLMDEITTELDLLARCDLLAFLREESEQQGCTILYATHILDRLEAWATHIAYMAGGRVQLFAPLAGVRELAALAAAGESAPLVALMEGWLRRDLGR
jgi:CCR4-NOT complex subunit CAF16